MKDFKIGQEVFLISREWLHNITRGIIVKKFESTNRWKVRVDYNKLFSGFEDIKERVVDKFYEDKNVFSSFDETYKTAMDIFEWRVKNIDEDRQKFIEEVNKDKKVVLVIYKDTRHDRDNVAYYLEPISQTKYYHKDEIPDGYQIVYDDLKEENLKSFNYNLNNLEKLKGG